MAELDVLDERAVAGHADAVAAGAGGIDIALNAVSFPYAQGTLLAESDRRSASCTRSSRFLRTQPHHRQGDGAAHDGARIGAILTLSTAGARFARPGNLGFGTTCAAIEQMTQRLAAELGPSGVRVVCLRPTAIADAASHGSYTGEVFAPLAAAAGVSVEEMLAQWGEDQTLLGRLPTLAQVADAAVFLASDRAGAITGAVIGPDLRQRDPGAAPTEGRSWVCSTRR